MLEVWPRRISVRRLVVKQLTAAQRTSCSKNTSRHVRNRRESRCLCRVIGMPPSNLTPLSDFCLGSYKGAQAL